MNWFRNLNVAYKIFLSCTIFIIMLVTTIFFSVSTMKNIEASVKDYREGSVLPVIKMDSLAKNFLQGRINMFAASVAVSEGNAEELAKRMKDTALIGEDNQKILKIIKDRPMTENEKKLTEQYETLYIELGRIMNDYVKALDEKDKVKITAVMNAWYTQFNLAKEALDKLHAESLKTGGEKITAEFEVMQRAVIYMFIILGFSIVIGAIVTFILGRSISNPMKMGLAFAQKIADGDFTERIDINQNDEVGLLAKALNEAADNLEKTVTEIINASNNLAQAVEQISSGNQNLSQRTSEQASALEEVAATIEEANSSINQNYENSLNARQMSEVSSTVAAEGGVLVGDAVQSINEVNSSAKKIGEITNVINEIAFQTNLLALNAAVEAARAGEQGRGFAVVAGEVRNLAQRAGNAAKEIAHLINDTVEKVEKGTEKTYKSGDALKNIIESVKNVANFISEIAASSNEQKQGMGQISTAIVDLDSMTQHNAALVEETAAASEEMANQAQELRGLMSQFKIRNEVKITEKKVIKKNEKFSANMKLNAASKNGKTGSGEFSFEEQGFEKF